MDPVLRIDTTVETPDCWYEFKTPVEAKAFADAVRRGSAVELCCEEWRPIYVKRRTFRIRDEDLQPSS